MKMSTKAYMRSYVTTTNTHPMVVMVTGKMSFFFVLFPCKGAVRFGGKITLKKIIIFLNFLNFPTKISRKSKIHFYSFTNLLVDQQLN